MNAAASQRWRHFVGRWVEGSSRRARPIVAIALLGAVLGAAYTGAHLRVSTNREKMLSDELPFRKTLNHYRELFPQFVDTLVLVVDAATPEDARDAARSLASRLEDRDVFQDVYVPRSIDFLEHRALLYLSRDELDDLADRLAEVQPFLGRLTGDESLRGLFALLREALESDDASVDLTPVVRRVDAGIRAALAERPFRLSWRELMRDEAASPDDLRQFIRVKPRVDYGDLLPVGRAIETVRREAAALDVPEASAVRVRIVGGLAMSHEELQTLRRGAEWLGLAALGCAGALLFWGLRSGRLVAACVVTLLVGLVYTAAFAAAAIGHLNMVSVAFGVLYIGLGVDYSIHLSLRYREALVGGRESTRALSEAAQDVGGSLVLCAISTALGFYAFVPTAYAGVSELGLISGTGMFISLALNLTLLPALLTLLPLPPAALAPRAPGPWQRGLADLPVRRPRPVLVAASAAAVFGVVLLPAVRFDTNTLNLRASDSESIRAFRELLRTSETPPWSLTVLASGEDAARAAAHALEARPEVSRVLSLLDFVPSDQDEKAAVLGDTALMLGLDAAFRGSADRPTVDEQREAIRSLRSALAAWLRVPRGQTRIETVRDLASALEGLESASDGPGGKEILARLSEGLLGTLPANMRQLRDSLGAEPFERGDLPARLVERWIGPGGVWRVEAFPVDSLEDPAGLERFVAGVRAVAPDAAGSPVIMLESGRAVVGAFRQALVTAAVAMTLVLLALLRSARDVALVMAPLVLAGVVTCGAMVLLGLSFNFANVIALPLLLGVGVDNGIHMVDRARHGLGAARQPNPLRTSTGRAVVFSTLTTIASFGQLAFSPHPGTSGMGQLLSLGMGMTLLATLLVIPALLTRDRSRRGGATVPTDREPNA